MPQDSLRSRIYKSFLTCNDPKGTVDKSTVRKKKLAPSEMDKRIISQTARKNFYEFSESKLRREATASKEVADEFSSSSSSQLMEVSRGAQKLNRTIDSWSNGMKNDSKSEKIARDLFQGAIDLQQSLTILGKLQEASMYMTQGEESEYIERITTGTMGMEKTCFNRNEFRKRRLSADYSYGDGAEELKKMIRERLARQLFPNTTNMAERISFPASSMENSSSDFASTSTSNSSMVYTYANLAKQGNGKNQIAKRMGLELQPMQMHETLDKQFPGEKISDLRRPKFSMEMANTKRPKPITHKIAKRTSDSNHNTQQFRGILKHTAKEMDDYFNYSSNRHSREESLARTPAQIVLLKPLRVSQVEWEERGAQVFEQDEALNKKKFMKMKEKYPQQKNDNKVEALSLKKVRGSIGAEETAISRINLRKEAQKPKEDNWKPKECINVIKPKKRISHIPLDQNLQRNGAIVRKVLGSQKETVARKNLLSQAKIVPKFQDQVQGSVSKLKRKPNATGEHIHQDCTPTSDAASECSPFSTNQAIEEKVINEVLVEKSETINFGGKSNVQKPDRTQDSILNMKEKAGSSHQTFENCSEKQSSINHNCCTQESSKYIENEISVNKPGIPSNPSHSKNANGSWKLGMTPEGTPAIAGEGMESMRNWRKMNVGRSKMLGWSFRWWPIRESMKEAEEVVEYLEERILVGLIQELFA